MPDLNRMAIAIYNASEARDGNEYWKAVRDLPVDEKAFVQAITALIDAAVERGRQRVYDLYNADKMRTD